MNMSNAQFQAAIHHPRRRPVAWIDGAQSVSRSASAYRVCANTKTATESSAPVEPCHNSSPFLHEHRPALFHDLRGHMAGFARAHT